MRNGAIKDFEEAIKINPNNADTFINSGKAPSAKMRSENTVMLLKIIIEQ